VQPTIEVMQQGNEKDDVIINSSGNQFSATPIANVVSKDEDDDEDAMMDEFLSNFVDSTEEAVQKNDETRDIMINNPRNQIIVPPTANVIPKDEDDEDAMMDEFLSNFVEPAQVEVQQHNKSDSDSRDNSGDQIIVPPTTSVVPNREVDDEDSMMDEFVSNFVEPTIEEVQQEIAKDSDKKHSPAIEMFVPPVENVDPKDGTDDAAMMNFNGMNNDENKIETNDVERRLENSLVAVNDNIIIAEEKNDDETAMEEFLSNFVGSTQDQSESHIVSNYDSLSHNRQSGEEDEEQPLISTPSESIMERGFEGERSPLLPSSTSATNKTREETKSEIEKHNPEETSSWYSALFHWVPVIVAAPIVYMVINAAHQPKV